MKIITIAAVLTTLYVVNPFTGSTQIKWPEITSECRPWGRWWWQGSALNKDDVTWNMEQYRAAGLGGMEITPVYGVKGTEKQFISFLSPSWMDLLTHTVQVGKRLGMGIDLANATGWPFGGPWVTDADAGKEMFWKTYTLKGGTKLAEPVRFIQPPLLIQVGQRVNIRDVKQPFSANDNMQQLAIDQVRFETPLPLSVLMAYNNSGTSIDLTNSVKPDGMLEWEAPPGDWKLYAVFAGFHGKMVERAAPGGEGYVIDHFSKAAIENYLKRFDQAFDKKNGKLIRAFFNDSYEVDDAQGQANFTPALFEEFKTRRGYDLRNHLPDLLTTSVGDINTRVLCDYRQTISDLLLDNFTKPWQAWARSKGSVIRNQAHGSPANILDLYAAADIPETEGNDVMGVKFATSAAHVSGKRLASTESGTWLNEHFLTKLSDVKQSVDRCFVGGVNHVFYHGVNYSPKSAPWPGWLFYAAVNFVPADPFWRDFGSMNHYFTRCQSFLQQGKPDNDVLLYMPIDDSFSEYGEGLLRHYHNMEQFKASGFEKSAREMLNKGYAFDFISDRQIIDIHEKGGSLVTGDATYKTLVLPACDLIPLKTFERIVDLAAKGAQIIVFKKLPGDIPGLGAEDARAKLTSLIASLHFEELTTGVQKAIVGKGAFMMGNDLQQLLSAAKISRETLTDGGLQFSRRINGKGKTYFIVNQTNKVFAQKVALNTTAAAAVLFDPMYERYGLAAISKQSSGTELYLQLQPGESCIVQTSIDPLKGQPYRHYQPTGNQFEIKGNWKLSFLQGGPVIPPPVNMDTLKQWTAIEGEHYKTFSGVGKYSIVFRKPRSKARMWRLSLDKALGSAEVYLNGAKIATLLGPYYIIDIPDEKFTQTNELEIRIVNSMANRIIDMEHKKLPYKIFYNVNFQARDSSNRGPDKFFTAKNWQPLPSGLTGKVTLTPLSVVE